MANYEEAWNYVSYQERFHAGAGLLDKTVLQEKEIHLLVGDDDLAQFLKDCWYMVFTMAKLLHPGGHEMVQGGDAKKASKATRAALAAGNTTLFGATALYGHLRAQVDILQCVGDVLHLIKVTSMSIDGTVPHVSLFRGKKGGIDSSEATTPSGDFRVVLNWTSELERMLPTQ